MKDKRKALSPADSARPQYVVAMLACPEIVETCFGRDRQTRRGLGPVLRVHSIATSSSSRLVQYYCVAWMTVDNGHQWSPWWLRLLDKARRAPPVHSSTGG